MLARSSLPLHALLASLGWALEDGSAEFYAAVRAGGVGVDSNATATLTRLPEWASKTGAVCLDGSPMAYYHRKGVGSGANKWYIHHEGGGWCESLADCLVRSKVYLGSTVNATASRPLAGGYFDPSPNVNPMMYNWNVVFLLYCDGGSFSGNNQTVATVGGFPLHFRGKRNREAVYASLLAAKGLGAATDVVVSGCSAGGLATFLHTDQWCDALATDAPAAKCVGMPDSGFFLDYQAPGTPGAGLGSTKAGNYHAGLRWVFETMNTTAGLNADCVNAKGTGGPATDDPAYLCQFAEHTAPFTHTPLFPLQSEYDHWQALNVLPVFNKPGVQILGDNITKRIKADLLGPHPRNGVFLDSCMHHCGSWDQIRIDGELVSTAFAKWYAGLDAPAAAKPKRAWVAGKPFGCKGCCTPY